MKKSILGSRFLNPISVSKALRSLKMLLDPAAHGNPYEVESNWTYKSNMDKSFEPRRSYQFGRRFGLR